MTMPRTKGAKNKPKKGIAVNFADEIASKSAEKDNLVTEIGELEENISALKKTLKEKNAELKAVNKKIAKLEEQNAAFDAAQEEAAKKAEIESVLNNLLANGVSASEILEKLK